MSAEQNSDGTVLFMSAGMWGQQVQTFWWVSAQLGLGKCGQNHGILGVIPENDVHSVIPSETAEG